MLAAEFPQVPIRFIGQVLDKHPQLSQAYLELADLEKKPDPPYDRVHNRKEIRLEVMETSRLYGELVAAREKRARDEGELSVPSILVSHQY